MVYKSFDDFASDVRTYLATLDETALYDQGAPSPLAYLELNAAGRTDLVEGCMQFGGFVAVSEKLNVRVRAASAAPVVYNPWVQPEEKNEAVSVVLSGDAKEAKMAADLERMRTAPQQTTQSPVSQPQAMSDSSSDPFLLGYENAKTATSAGNAAAGESSSSMGVARYFRFDGLQRANVGLLAGLLALGFGRTSSEVFDISQVEVVRFAALTLVVAHVAASGYGFLLASSASPRESPPLWFFKIATTGIGGLAELRRSIEKQAS